MKDYYYILGIEREADIITIKSAYRKLSLKFHPDKNDGDKFFEERFKEIQEAYEVLSNPQKRNSYDQVYKNSSNNHWSKEEELRRREEELRRKEEELKRKYQTPEEREREIRAQQAKKKAEEEAKTKQEILKHEVQLAQKEKELSKVIEEQKRINTEITFLRNKIAELKGKINKNAGQNQQKYQTKKFTISDFPKLQQDLNFIKDYIAAYDFQTFRKIFIQFTKNHSIDIHLINKHKEIVDIVVNERVPIKETERLFHFYKDNNEFVSDLEKEIIRILK